MNCALREEQQWRIDREAGQWTVYGYGCQQPVDSIEAGIRFIRKYAPAFEQQFKAKQKGK